MGLGSDTPYGARDDTACGVNHPDHDLCVHCGASRCAHPIDFALSELVDAVRCLDFHPGDPPYAATEPTAGP